MTGFPGIRRASAPFRSAYATESARGHGEADGAGAGAGAEEAVPAGYWTAEVRRATLSSTFERKGRVSHSSSRSSRLASR